MSALIALWRACHRQPTKQTLRQLVHEAAKEYLAQKLTKVNVMSKPQAVVDYARIALGPLIDENVMLITVGSQNHVIRTRILWTGTVDRCPMLPRPIVEYALQDHAASCIIVHNHPSGDPTPSEPDKGCSNEIDTALRTLGMKLLDFIIVSRFGHTSFQELGYLSYYTRKSTA